jgi:hypothetical protein
MNSKVDVGPLIKIFSKDECDQIIEYGNSNGWSEFDHMHLNNVYSIITQRKENDILLYVLFIIKI